MSHTDPGYEKRVELACRQLQSDATQAFVLATTAEENALWVLGDRSDSGEEHYRALLSLFRKYADSLDKSMEEVTQEMLDDIAAGWGE